MRKPNLHNLIIIQQSWDINFVEFNQSVYASASIVFWFSVFLLWILYENFMAKLGNHCTIQSYVT